MKTIQITIKRWIASCGMLLVCLTVVGCEAAPAEPEKPADPEPRRVVKPQQPDGDRGDLADGDAAVRPAGPDDDLQQTGVGEGKRGHGYGGDPITEPLRALVRTEERLIFEVQIPHGMKMFEGLEGRPPRSHEEFMKRIIEDGQIELPELEAGKEYIYVPERKELMQRDAQ